MDPFKIELQQVSSVTVVLTKLFFLQAEPVISRQANTEKDCAIR